MNYVGDFLEDATVYIPFNTFDSNDPSASVTITDLVAGDVEVWKNGVVQTTPGAGVTVTLNIGTNNGTHLIAVDTSNTTDAGWFVTGADFQVRINGTTVDGATINAWVGTFSTENRFKEVTVTSMAANVITAAAINADAITNAKIADDAIAVENIKDAAITAAKFAANAITSTVVADNTITAAKLNADCITNAKIADNAIAVENIKDAAITAAKFAANAITSTVVADNTITAAKLNADCITNAKIADNAIAAENLATAAIAADAVASTAFDNIVMSDLATGAPSVTASLPVALNWLYEAFRNKTTTTATLVTLKKDDGSTDLAKATISDAAGTTTKEEFVSG
ncbi:hypothetical protein LCGC14_1628110 [marine sediment metagenome]|uniref:Uncharacterized protein n=1 Tax=marine sediment metagenome TaxID=412755 RepID=A0A0F9KJ39_9ZZZZ